MTDQPHRNVLLVNGPARQDRPYPMPNLPDGIADPPEFLSLEKPAERGGKLTIDSPRLIAELYRLFRDRSGAPAVDDGNIVYTHIPDSDRDDLVEAELEQRRQWCTHPREVVIKRQTPEASPGMRYCPDCKQALEQQWRK